MKELILGGVRSGKSRLAGERAATSGAEVVYVATATAEDGEMAERVARHRQERPTHWWLVEEPRALGAVLEREAGPQRCLLVDCLTLWLANVLATGELEGEREALLAALATAPGRILLVSNEVGQGVVPMDPHSRRFVDEAGRLHQVVADRCHRVTWVAAGLPLTLKGEAP